MKHNVKVGLFKILEFFPKQMGDAIYYKFQNFSKNIPLEIRLKSVENTYSRLDEICDTIGLNFKDKIIFEFGSGWFPAMPYFFVYKGLAKKVITVDINEHFEENRMKDFNALFSKEYGVAVKVKENRKFSMPAEVDYFPNYNVIREATPQADIIFSRYVLSHMTEEDVVSWHEKIKKNYPKDTYIIHFISPSDLRQHGDSSLSLQDFLQYSKKEWNKIHTRFNYHNRLRLPQFVAIFKKAGLEIKYLTYQSLQKETYQYELFKKVKLHSDYEGFTDEELTAGDIVVVLKT